jgi:hypothetical protein
VSRSNSTSPNGLRVVDPLSDPDPLPEIVVRRFAENGCTVTALVVDLADQQVVVYGTVTRPGGVLVGSFYATAALVHTFATH